MKLITTSAICMGLLSATTIMPASAEGMDAAMIKAFLSGKSIAGRENGSTYIETYNADGTITGVEQGEIYKGTWTVNEEGLVCFDYEDDDDDECNGVKIIVQWTHSDDPAYVETGQVIAGPPWSSAADVTAALIGKKVSGIYDGDPYSETYSADGTIAGEEDGKAFTGRWSFNAEGQLCHDYDDEDGEDDECNFVSVNGTTVNYYNTFGEPAYSATIQ